MSDLEARVIALLVEETHIKAKNVNLGSRLAQDIGMDGDDAVEFFEKFGATFDVDLSVLTEQWERHFLPEGGGPGMGFLMVIGAGVVAGGLVHEVIRSIPVWAATLVLIPVLLWIYSRFLEEVEVVHIPITVQDLVEAASSGQWTKNYE